VNIRNRTPLHRLPIFHVIRVQALMVVVVTLVCGVLFGRVAGYSGLLGSLIALLANVFFASKAFRYFGARSSKAIVQSLWSGAMGKQILTAALFALVFVGVKPLQPVALFAGYLLVLGTGASGLLLMKKNPKH
jgi:ATP synthase protein I